MRNRPRLLMVCPETEPNETLLAALSDAGYRVSRAPDRKSALPLMFDMHPDLVLLYAMSAPKERWDILSQIRSFSDDPIILIGCSPGTAEAEDGIRLGANACLGPDATTDQLLEEIGKLMDPHLSGKSRPGTARERRRKDNVPLRFLTPAQLTQIDQALAEVGSQGEVRLVKTRGRLRVITKVATKVIVPAGG